jgi:hypothetical protein
MGETSEEREEYALLTQGLYLNLKPYVMSKIITSAEVVKMCETCC